MLSWRRFGLGIIGTLVAWLVRRCPALWEDTGDLFAVLLAATGPNGATDYEIVEGPRGSTAVRKRNCQDSASPSGLVDAVKTVGIDGAGVGRRDASRRGNDPSALDCVPSRRLSRRAAESK